MGKILQYPDLGAPPAITDLLFIGDYSGAPLNPVTKHVSINNLNKKYQIWAADGTGLKVTDDGGTYGLHLHDGGNIGVGPGAATTPGAFLSVRGAADSNLTLANFLNPSATTDGKYQQIIFGTDAANDKSVVFRYYYSTTDDASTFRIQSYEDAAAANQIGLHLKGDGNVGVGTIDPEFNLEVEGDFGVYDDNYGVMVDASLGELHGIYRGGGSTASGPLHLNRGAGGDVWLMYGDGSSPALKVESTDKKISIGHSTAAARLDIKEADGASTPVLKLHNAASGTPYTAMQLTTSSDSQYLFWDGSSLAIKNTIGPIGAGSVNFGKTGKIAINQAVGTRNLEASETSGEGIVASLNSTSSGKGSKILFVNTTDSESVNQSQGFGFSSNLSGTQTVSWFGGVYRPSGSTRNYFALNYVGAAASGGDSLYTINTTLANNPMYLDDLGNVRFKATVQASAYYDQGGDSAGNYCRGRFIQTFSYRYFYTVTGNQRWTPLFSEPVDTTNNYDHDGSTTPDKSMCSKAPMAGRVTRLDVSFTNNVSNNSVSAYVYSGTDAPTTDLSSSNAAYTGTISLGGSLTEGDYTIGYDDFTEPAGQTNRDFAAGEFLMLAIDNSTGNGNATVVVTVEFDVPDNLGA
jgi:hypothetical protein